MSQPWIKPMKLFLITAAAALLFTSPIAIRRAFGNGTLYAGGGPVLFGIETNFFNGVPFATSTQGTFPTSVPLTNLNDNWVWGGAGWRDVRLRPAAPRRFSWTPKVGLQSTCSSRKLRRRPPGPRGRQLSAANTDSNDEIERIVM